MNQDFNIVWNPTGNSRLITDGLDAMDTSRFIFTCPADAKEGDRHLIVVCAKAGDLDTFRRWRLRRLSDNVRLWEQHSITPVVRLVVGKDLYTEGFFKQLIAVGVTPGEQYSLNGVYVDEPYTGPQKGNLMVDFVNGA